MPVRREDLLSLMERAATFPVEKNHERFISPVASLTNVYVRKMYLWDVHDVCVYG